MPWVGPAGRTKVDNNADGELRARLLQALLSDAGERHGAGGWSERQLVGSGRQARISARVVQGNAGWAKSTRE